MSSKLEESFFIISPQDSLSIYNTSTFKIFVDNTNVTVYNIIEGESCGEMIKNDSSNLLDI